MTQLLERRNYDIQHILNLQDEKIGYSIRLKVLGKQPHIQMLPSDAICVYLKSGSSYGRKMSMSVDAHTQAGFLFATQ